MKARINQSSCRFYSRHVIARLCTVRAVIFAWLFAIITNGVAGESDQSHAVQAGPTEFVQTVLKPFWRTTEIREPIFFIEGRGSERPLGKLLFKPTEILSVSNGTRDLKFQPNKDFLVNSEVGTISLPEGSRILVTTREHVYPLMSSDLPKIARKSGDRTRGIFFDEGSAYHKLQTQVTYHYEPGQWRGPVPRFAGDLLPKTIAKLRGKHALTLVLFGDSISLGANASGWTNTPPGCPPFGKLMALALDTHYGSKITFVNQAVDGSTSRNGLQQVNEARTGKVLPDLVLIAFGMNDVYYGREASSYKRNISGMIERIRADSPATEFILVSPMLANAERGIPLDKFWQYRDSLAELVGPGVALADLTAFWGEMLKRKSFYDLTGNGVNHPNDFGHCVYAEVLLALLVSD
jgi:acyl-CoA thioesterase I